MLIPNVFLLYGKITLQQLNAKKIEVENMEYQLSETINTIFSAIEDLQEIAELAGRPVTPQKIVNCR